MTSDSKEVKVLKASLNVTNSLLELMEQLDSLPNMKKARYTDTRSLYQAVSKGRELEEMQEELEVYFGPPAKPAGKSISLLLRRNPSIKYLGGIRDEQILFIKKVKTGFYYGALWPWRRDPTQVTVHIGFLSPGMSDKGLKEMEELVKSMAMHEKVLEKLKTGPGGQVQGIPLATFLQMAAVEKITCTLAVQKDQDIGYLDLLDGDLISAEVGHLKGMEAALKLINWPNTVIEIEEASGETENQINLPMMNILVEAAKIRKEEEPADAEIVLEVADADGIITLEAADEDPDAVITLKDEVSEAVDAYLDEQAAEEVKGPPKRKPKKRKLKISLSKKNIIRIAAAVILLGAGGFLAMRFIQSKRVEDAYNGALAEAEKAPTLRAKESSLQSFIDTYPQSKWAPNATQKITEIRNLFAKKDLRVTLSKAEELTKNNNYEALIALYQVFLRKHPHSTQAVKIRRKFKEVSIASDNKDYNELVKSAAGGTLDKVFSYFSYLKKHPTGQYSDAVKKTVAGMSAEYYHLVSQGIHNCSNQENWQECVQLSENFVAIYPDHEMAGKIKEFKVFAAERLKDQNTLAELKQTAAGAGQDYKAAKQIYFTYLNAHPNSSLKDKILAEIELLKEQERLAHAQNAREELTALLKESGGRFVDNHNDTIKDTRTGLVWCLLDSQMKQQKCLTYEEAKEYVKALETGGYKDWRLPTESELVEIYKKTPFFPARKTEWYWTSKSFSRYSDGWQEMVHIVTTKPETQWEKEQVNANDCGAVQAVRP